VLGVTRRQRGAVERLWAWRWTGLDCGLKTWVWERGGGDEVEDNVPSRLSQTTSFCGCLAGDGANDLGSGQGIIVYDRDSGGTGVWRCGRARQ
jgi:hypothetical protein